LTNKIQKLQFVGCHQCLCVTLRHPPQFKSMIDISTSLTEIGSFGRVFWLGTANMYTYGRSTRMSAKIYIRKNVWSPQGTPLSGAIHTTAITHQLDAGEKRFQYWFLSIPAIQHSYVVPEFIRFEES